MKKILCTMTVLALAMMALAGCSGQEAQSEDTDSAAQTDTAAAWTVSDQEGVQEATGFELTAPEGAADVAYSYRSDSGTAQLCYVLDGTDWTYRMQMADEATDLSDLTYSWTAQEEGTVSGRSATYYSYQAPEDGTDKDVQAVTWYDVVPGVAYSLAAVGEDLDGMDIQAYAEALFVPLQGEATDDPEGDRQTELNDAFLGTHERSDDGSTLTIADNGDGTFKIDLSITRLCSLEDGVGTFDDHKMTFVADDPNGNELSGMIYRDSDNSLTVKITDSTWTYLSNDEVLDGFGR